MLLTGIRNIFVTSPGIESRVRVPKLGHQYRWNIPWGNRATILYHAWERSVNILHYPAGAEIRTETLTTNRLEINLIGPYGNQFLLPGSSPCWRSTESKLKNTVSSSKNLDLNKSIKVLQWNKFHNFQVMRVLKGRVGKMVEVTHRVAAEPGARARGKMFTRGKKGSHSSPCCPF